MLLQAWSLDNLRKIGGQLGSVVDFDEQTVERTSFSSAKILLETCYYQHIQGNVFLSIKGEGYDVVVKEMGCGAVLSKNEEDSTGSTCKMAGEKNPVVAEEAGKSTNRIAGEKNPMAAQEAGKSQKRLPCINDANNNVKIVENQVDRTRVLESEATTFSRL